MKYWILSILTAAVLATSGCLTTQTHLQKEIEEKDRQFLVVTEELKERNREIVTAIKDVISTIPEEERRDSDNLIFFLASEGQRINGLPIQRISVEEILLNFQKSLPSLTNYVSNNTNLLRQSRFLDAELDMLKSHEANRPEEKKNWFLRLIGWLFGLGVPAIIGIIALCIFFPTLGLPIVTKIIERITCLIPSLITILGVTGKNVVDKIISGIEGAKQAIEKEPEDKTFTKQEVKNLLAQHLKQASDDDTEKVVRYRKGHLKSKNKI